MADLDLEEIRAMLAAATPGPWQALSWTAQDHDELTRDLSAMFGEGGLTVHFLWDGQPWNDTDKPALAPAITGNGRKSAENAALIASAPATIAALVAEVEANRAEIARLRTLLPSAEELDTAIDACAEARERVCWDPTRFDVATAWLSRVAEEVDRV